MATTEFTTQLKTELRSQLRHKVLDSIHHNPVTPRNHEGDLNAAVGKNQETEAFQFQEPVGGPNTTVSPTLGNASVSWSLPQLPDAVQGMSVAEALIVTRPLPGHQPTDSERASRAGNAAVACGKATSADDSGPLMSFEDALDYLKMSDRSLRDIVQRSKEKLKDKCVAGPTICFFQIHAKGAIKFRREWLDDFIRRYTHNPHAVARRPPEVRRSKTHESGEVGFGFSDGAAGPNLGFDSDLYDL